MMNEDYIREINFAYHEEEAAIYENIHPEIFEQEIGRWKKISAAVSQLKELVDRPIRLLDIGTGTGFVPVNLSKVLGADDEFFLTDISPGMLEQAKQVLLNSSIQAKTFFHIIKSDRIDELPGKFDLVTMNSVLHHLPDYKSTLRKIDSMLLPGGLLVISHEPNKRHFRHPIVGPLSRFLYNLRKSYLYVTYRQAGSNKMIIDINRRLISNGVIETPMTENEIQSVVDINSPTAGRKIRSERGFDPFKLIEDFYSEYKVLDLETYNHFNKISRSKLKWLGPVPKMVEKKFPDAGALFSIILKKS